MTQEFSVGNHLFWVDRQTDGKVVLTLCAETPDESEELAKVVFTARQFSSFLNTLEKVTK